MNEDKGVMLLSSFSRSLLDEIQNSKGTGGAKGDVIVILYVVDFIRGCCWTVASLTEASRAIRLIGGRVLCYHMYQQTNIYHFR